ARHRQNRPWQYFTVASVTTTGYGDITLDGPDNDTRKAYRDAIEMTCTDTRCEGRMPTEQVHLTILTPTAENDVGFANMSMGALMNACRPQEQE
ncbi:MAG: hypothetical protein ACU0CV_04745, partial [Sagittula sp.]